MANLIGEEILRNIRPSWEWYHSGCQGHMAGTNQTEFITRHPVLKAGVVGFPKSLRQEGEMGKFRSSFCSVLWKRTIVKDYYDIDEDGKQYKRNVIAAAFGDKRCRGEHIL